MNQLAIGLAFAGVLTSATASGYMHDLDALDRDGSGGVTLEESLADAQLSMLFVDLDANRNGAIDEGELALFDQVARDRMMALEPTCRVR
jgi:hypothetical protein